MTERNWIDKYLRSHYYGCVAGNYEKGCHLYFKDINNFIQNVGRFSNVEIIRYDGETLLNTQGIYIDRIWPELSWNDRETNGIRDSVNYVAMKLGELRIQDGPSPAPLPKVNTFMMEVLGKDVVERNMEIVKGLQVAEMEEGVKEMSMIISRYAS